MDDDEKIYRINYDNASHIKYLRGKKEKNILTKKYTMGMLLLMVAFENAWHADRINSKDSSDKYKDDINDFKDDFRRMAARGAAQIVLCLITKLPKSFD